ncbi:hypothetical protein ACEZCY_18345 [Streptacidiphilus sp. N1-12]|uniref:Uncharacterized protein n=2 Tax=Streptacidiphilus alkalitolerans TaxID=3342712 RepID=A0ABV6VBV7_9ACTN
MARAISADDVHLLNEDQDLPEPAQAPPAGGAGSLLRAVALQRPVYELAQLMMILDQGDQPAHAQAILTTAATLRPVADLAALVPLLGDSQAANALHAAAAQRSVEELAELVQQLHNPKDPALTTQQARWRLRH